MSIKSSNHQFFIKCVVILSQGMDFADWGHTRLINCYLEPSILKGKGSAFYRGSFWGDEQGIWPFLIIIISTQFRILKPPSMRQNGSKWTLFHRFCVRLASLRMNLRDLLEEFADAVGGEKCFCCWFS